MKRKTVIDIICALFVLLFVYAAMSKLLDYNTFKVQLGKSPLISSAAPLVAGGLPLLEIGIGILLFFSKTKMFGLYFSLFLMVTFTAYLIAILNFSSYVPCSCGGILNGLSWDTHIIFNSCFIVLALIGISLQSKGKNTSNTYSNMRNSDLDHSTLTLNRK